MVVKINRETINEIEKIATSYNLTVEFFEEAGTRYSAESVKSKKLVRIRSVVDSEDFDYQFKQLGQSFEVEHSQDMFVFNLFHEIGHFELNLWKKHFGETGIAKTMGQLDNLEIDKPVNEWAYKKFREWKERSSSY